MLAPDRGCVSVPGSSRTTRVGTARTVHGCRGLPRLVLGRDAMQLPVEPVGRLVVAVVRVEYPGSTPASSRLLARSAAGKSAIRGWSAERPTIRFD